VRRLVGRSRAQLLFRDLVLRMGARNPWVAREDLARRYLFGDGLEIGALTLPLRVPPRATVRHADRMSREDLIREDGPMLRSLGLDPEAIPPISVVDSAERLATVADRSLDFVVANHVLEHLEDPIEALENLARVLRPGGIIMLTLPDASRTWDAARARTTVEHLLRDHRDGPETSRRGHYAEWATYIEGVGEPGLAARVQEFADADARHHFHAWALADFLELLRALSLPCELRHAQAYGKEFAVVLRRDDSTGPTCLHRPAG
jgi:predicted SAM-dependent methyltransferase